MATKVQRRNLGFEKFFKRKSPSLEEPSTGMEKITNEDNAAKVECDTIKCATLRSGKFADEKSTNENDEAGGEKTDGSRKSSTQKKPGGPEESTKTEENKRDDSEACKEYVIKDESGQVKLAEIINNSIKEAVLNIVKEGVCSPADIPDPRVKEPRKKSLPSNVEETQDKENKPECPKNLSSLQSSANKTFDSHLCQCKLPIQQERSTLPQSPRRTSDQERPIVNQCNRELCPRVSRERKTKSPKCTRQKEKKSREVCPKITRPVKGSSHFRTDNRRMTGNVNIYICSEANENTKDQKNKQKDGNQCPEESDTNSETKTCDSTLSISTSKLVAALRKKKCKNLDNQSLSCLCETPDSSKQHQSVDSICEPDDDVLCLCDENREFEFPNSGSSTSSRDGCIYENEKFSELDFPDSGQDSVSQSFDRYTTYDRSKSWSCTTDDCPSYENNSKRLKTEKQSKIAEKDLDERCSCCNLKRCQKERSSTVPCQKDRKSLVEKSCDRNPSETTNRCLCIVEEEEEEDCCTDKKEPEEKFTVCTNRRVAYELPITDEQKKELEKIASQSDSGKLKLNKTESSKSETGTARTSASVSTTDAKMIDKKNDLKIKEKSKMEKPKSPKKKSKKSSDKPDSKELAGEASKPTDQVTNNKSQSGAKTTASKEENDNSPIFPDKKQKSSFFRRSIDKAMSIVKTRKDNENAGETEGNKKSEGPVPEPKSEMNLHTPPTDQKAMDPSCESCCGVIEEQPIVMCDNVSDSEKRSKTRICTALASRKSSATTTNNSSNVCISPCPVETDTMKSPQSKDQCECEKPPESCDCCFKNPEPVRDESCKCCTTKIRKVATNLSVCLKKIETPRPESRACCPICQNPMDKCCCCPRQSEPVESKPCKCCPKCRRPLTECKCCCAKQNKPSGDVCKCCCSPKRMCCCDTGEKSRVNKPQPVTCCRPPDIQENCCDRRSRERDDRELKSMICIYCDNPRDNCVCNAPIRKCSQCCVPLDVCNCKPTPCCECSGRQIVPVEDNNEQTICVTAWKPRRNVRRYFARSINNADDISDEDCACWDNTKPYGSDGLPYQRRGVFSDVMSELQQKMSGSVCCHVCKKVPCCCCCMERESEEKVEMKSCLSTIAERRSPGRSQKKSRSKSPADSCKCGPTPRRRSTRQPVPSRICDRCRTSPCRCRRSSKSPQKKPQAKCYYCKSSPCICVPANQMAKSRPFRNAESSRRRRKERCSSIEENINIKIDNEDNGCNRFVPCPGNQQQTRKYCYRENPNGPNPGERVR